MPAVVELTVSVAVPEPPVILPGLTVQDRPAEQVDVRLTVPVNPLTGATVIVTVAVSPALTLILVVLAVIVKSVTVSWKLPADPEWTVSPLYVPVIVCVPALPAAGV